MDDKFTLASPTPTVAASTNAPTAARYKALALLVLLAGITYLDRLCISAAAPSIRARVSSLDVTDGLGLQRVHVRLRDL